MDKKKKSKTAVIINETTAKVGHGYPEDPNLDRWSTTPARPNSIRARHRYCPNYSNFLPTGWHGFTHPATRITALITAAYQPNRANNRILSFLGSGVQTPGYQIFILALPSFLLQVFLLFFLFLFFLVRFIRRSQPRSVNRMREKGAGGKWWKRTRCTGNNFEKKKRI